MTSDLLQAFSTMVGTVGFPIAAFLLLWNFNTKAIGALTDAILTLKEVVQKLDTKIDTQIDLTKEMLEEQKGVKNEN